MIYNHTRRNVVCQEVELAFTFFARLKGLMLREELAAHKGLLLRPCRSVHTFFMRFPLDVVFLDEQYLVVGVAEGLRPWQFSKHFKRAYCALELPAGTVARIGLQKGDALELRVRPHS